MKRFSFISIFLFFMLYSFSSNAQKWVWGRSSQGTQFGYDEAWSIAKDPTGNIYITGDFNSGTMVLGTYTLTNGGNVFLAKYDTSGKVLWAKNATNTGSYSGGHSVVTDATGNIYVTGVFDSPTVTFGAFTLSNAGSNQNIFLVKYNSSGTVLWAKKAGGVNQDRSWGVATDNSGNVYITGSFLSPTITFGSITLSLTIGNIFLVKYDPSGNVLWAKSSVGGGEGHSVATDAFGNVYITGDFVSAVTFGNYTLNNTGPSSNIFLVKYDASGNVLWANAAGISDVCGSNSVTTDVSGNSYITGYYSSTTMTLGNTTLANPNVFLAKYDTSGKVLWARSAGGTTYLNQGNCIAADIFGNVYVSGAFASSFISFGSDTLQYPAGGGNPMFVVKYNSNGDELCASTLACGGGTLPNGIVADYFGNVYFAGGFMSPIPITVGPNTISQVGGEDVFVAKYTCCGAKVIATITGTDTICRGSSSALNASAGSYYLWNTGATSQSVIVSPSSATTYTLSVKDNHGCAGDTTSFTVTVLPSPTANVSSNINIFQGQSTTINANGGNIYLWSNGSKDSTINVMPNATTKYCVTVMDTSINRCADTSCVTVYVESPCDTAGAFFFPNAFSPNNDGENDALKIYYNEMNCIATLHLIIYDRWGELIYETSDKNFSWDGIYPSKTLNTQVLAYQLTVGFTDGKAINRKGNISLMR